MTTKVPDSMTNLQSGAQGAGLVLLGTQTASASASIIFSSIPAGFDAYLLELSQVIPATNTQTMLMTFSDDNGSTYKSSSYSWGHWRQALTTSQGTGSNSDTTMSLLANNGQSNVAYASGHYTLHGLGAASGNKMFEGIGVFFDGSNWNTETTMGGYTGGSNAINAIKLFYGSGNITSGKFNLYGLRNS